MHSLLSLILPELILISVACVLLLMGLSVRPTARRAAPLLGVLALMAAFGVQIARIAAMNAGDGSVSHTQFDSFGASDGTVRIYAFAQYIKLIVAGVGAMLLLLAWPTRRDGTGNPALNLGPDAAEFYGLALISIAGVMLVAGANDMMLLFLGIELASIPTYIMVSLSRPQAVAQEAGVKYFFLGAMSAALMLMGFAWIYGTTGGATTLYEVMLRLHAKGDAYDWTTRLSLTPWQTLGVLLVIAGFLFKMAAVPLHFYAGDVYQGAATPVTAFLSFVPKTSGFVALIKLLAVLGGSKWLFPWPLVKENGTGLLFVLAILTMTIGNVLGLIQYNVKRVLAYSSIAHTGYMLAALAALAVGQQTADKDAGLRGLLFYLAAYGVMNVGAFGVLSLLPSRDGRGSAETYEDLAGQGRRHIGLGLAMAVCCFSLIGIPLTVGFMGKLMIIKPALDAAVSDAGANPARTAMIWLVVITVVNAAISAGYYLAIIASLFLRTEDSVAAPPAPQNPPGMDHTPSPIYLGIGLSVVATLLFGTLPAATELLNTGAKQAVDIEATHPTTPGIPPVQPMAAR